MLKLKETKKTPLTRTRKLTLAIILLLSSFIAYLFMILPGYLDNRGVQINIGEAATEDILAPYSINFESKVLTERARQNAANAVEDVYLTSDPSIARHQLNVLDAALSYITTVKNDPLSTHEQKIEDLLMMQDLKLSVDDYSKILLMEMNDWQAVGVECSRVLETVLRENLREHQIESARTNLHNIINFNFKR